MLQSFRQRVLLLSVILSVAFACKNEGDHLVLPQNRPTTHSWQNDFIVKASLANKTEVQLGPVAQSQSNNESVKTLGGLMVSEYTNAQNDLILLAENKNTSLPDSLDTGYYTLKDQLVTLTGTDFDLVFLKDQQTRLQQSKLFYEQVIAQGHDPDIKSYAEKFLPFISAHLILVENVIQNLPSP